MHVDHSMRIMRDETFGRAVGILPLKNEEKAIRLMNDSHFGPTGAVWTKYAKAAEIIGKRLRTRAVFMNFCDHLDHALCGMGGTDTDRGAELSVRGFHTATHLKTYHLKKAKS